MWDELNFGLDQLIINDSPILPLERKTSFLNIKSTREGIESRENFPFENKNEEREIIYLKVI